MPNLGSAFEFGCNSGKKLLGIDCIDNEKISCCRVDINESAIALDQASGLKAVVALEEILYLVHRQEF